MIPAKVHSTKPELFCVTSNPSIFCLLFNMATELKDEFDRALNASATVPPASTFVANPNPLVGTVAGLCPVIGVASNMTSVAWTYAPRFEAKDIHFKLCAYADDAIARIMALRQSLSEVSSVLVRLSNDATRKLSSDELSVSLHEFPWFSCEDSAKFMHLSGEFTETVVVFLRTTAVKRIDAIRHEIDDIVTQHVRLIVDSVDRIAKAACDMAGTECWSPDRKNAIIEDVVGRFYSSFQISVTSSVFDAFAEEQKRLSSEHKRSTVAAMVEQASTEDVVAAVTRQVIQETMIPTISIASIRSRPVTPVAISAPAFPIPTTPVVATVRRPSELRLIRAPSRARGRDGGRGNRLKRGGVGAIAPYVATPQPQVVVAPVSPSRFQSAPSAEDQDWTLKTSNRRKGKNKRRQQAP